MPSIRSLAAAAALALAPTLAACAAPTADCLPTVEAAWVRTPPPGASMLAGYAVIANGCRAPVAIVGAEADDFGMAMIHRTVEEGGVSRMREAGDLAVAPGARVVFAPGGAHVMLVQPKRALADGARTRIRFRLADGRTIAADFEVRRAAPR
jgi:copper(I)-binding protein